MILISELIKRDIFLTQQPIDHYNYASLISEAFQSIVIKILKRSVKEGLLGAHHFFITFQTQHKDVNIPQDLKTLYPEEMTIVLQHEFFEFIAEDHYFAVTLYFNKKPARLIIAYDAIIAFFDPTVDIRLFLKTPTPLTSGTNDAQQGQTNMNNPGQTRNTNVEKFIPSPSLKNDQQKLSPQPAEIISLDQFRPKKPE